MLNLACHETIGVGSERRDAGIVAKVNPLAAKDRTREGSRIFHRPAAGGEQFFFGDECRLRQGQILAFRSRKLLLTTKTLLKAIASAASIGFR